MLVINEHYRDRQETIMALSQAVNGEYHKLADAGSKALPTSLWMS